MLDPVPANRRALPPTRPRRLTGSGIANVSVSGWKRTFVVVVMGVVALTASSARPQAVPDEGDQESQPLESTLIETTEVSLVLREMLGVSSVTRSARETADLVVHERTMGVLRPGTYTLGAFVHDQIGGVFGGTETEIVLPALDDPVVVGPVLMRLGRSWVRTDLPIFDKKERDATPTRTRAVNQGPVPAPRNVDVGERLEAWTWICPSDARVAGKAVRYVSHRGEPIFAFELVEQTADGHCFQIRDVIETADLGAGPYAVHVRWQESTMDKPVVAETAFEIPRRPVPETVSTSPKPDPVEVNP